MLLIDKFMFDEMFSKHSCKLFMSPAHTLKLKKKKDLISFCLHRRIMLNSVDH